MKSRHGWKPGKVVKKKTTESRILTRKCGSKKRKIVALFGAYPDISVEEAAKRLKTAPAHIYKVLSRVGISLRKRKQIEVPAEEVVSKCAGRKCNRFCGMPKEDLSAMYQVLFDMGTSDRYSDIQVGIKAKQLWDKYYRKTYGV